MTNATPTFGLAPKLLFPKVFKQCLVVEVFLPKKILNQAALPVLLRDLMAFEPALLSLIDNIEDVYHEYLAAVPARRPTNWFAVDPPPLSREQFRDLVEQIQDRIVGYSIYETDGAFRGSERAREVLASELHCWTGPSYRVSSFANDIVNFVENIPDTKRHLRDKLRNAVGTPRSETVLELQHGLTCSILEQGNDCVTWKGLVPLEEERTLAIRFLVDLEVETSDSPHVFLPTHFPDTPAHKVAWETLMLIGYFLVRRLGRDVGIEDEIWIQYHLGVLWVWRKDANHLGTD